MNTTPEQRKDIEAILCSQLFEPADDITRNNLEVAYVNQAGTMLLYSTQRSTKEDIYRLNEGENCQIRSYVVPRKVTS